MSLYSKSIKFKLNDIFPYLSNNTLQFAKNLIGLRLSNRLGY